MRPEIGLDFRGHLASSEAVLSNSQPGAGPGLESWLRPSLLPGCLVALGPLESLPCGPYGDNGAVLGTFPEAGIRGHGSDHSPVSLGMPDHPLPEAQVVRDLGPARDTEEDGAEQDLCPGLSNSPFSHGHAGCPGNLLVGREHAFHLPYLWGY